MITISTSGLVILLAVGYLGINSIVRAIEDATKKKEEKEERK